MLFTKADLITGYELEALDRTRCELTCDHCGTFLPTEGDFARHFVIPDARYLNLGNCPHNEDSPDLTVNARLRIPTYMLPREMRNI